MPAYLTVDEFRLRTLLPAMVVDGLPAGWLEAQISGVSSRIDGRLSKRYGVPFGEPYPDVIKSWVVDVVSLNAWLKRGMAANDEAFAEYKAKHDRAIEEIREAADSEIGLFDLPRSTGPGGQVSGIDRGNTRVYSEQSPYAGWDRQSRTGRAEDRGGNGGSSS